VRTWDEACNNRVLARYGEERRRGGGAKFGVQLDIATARRRRESCEGVPVSAADEGRGHGSSCSGTQRSWAGLLPGPDCQGREDRLR